MTIRDFNTLELDQKGSLVFREGNYVDHRIQYGKYKIVIYSLFNFYVEVFLDINSDSVKNIKAIETENDWHGYLESINLDYLMR